MDLTSNFLYVAQCTLSFTNCIFKVKRNNECVKKSTYETKFHVILFAICCVSRVLIQSILILFKNEGTYLSMGEIISRNTYFDHIAFDQITWLANLSVCQDFFKTIRDFFIPDTFSFLSLDKHYMSIYVTGPDVQKNVSISEYVYTNVLLTILKKHNLVVIT